MSDIATPPVVGEGPAAPPLPPLGPVRRGWRGYAYELASNGWHAAAGWACVLILFVNGVVIPISRIWKSGLEPLDWKGVVAVASLLIVNGAGFAALKIFGGSSD